MKLYENSLFSLRVLLIQKDFKQMKLYENSLFSLRVLLIQKDFKL